MSARLATHMVVAALIRRVQHGGGHAAVLAIGDRDAGGLLVQCCERGRLRALLEQTYDFDGSLTWRDVELPDIADQPQIESYFARRRTRDTDLWLVEIDIDQPDQFVRAMFD